ncbi:hypothetical protein Pan14r_48360 [Crateriforma conspicua]|uniref:Uncharacterized protein n=1 Tax=Crateriforma conspicua TaxID=2527996 RepID=A0A5C5YA00_9PLAN|nr:hypothetical protein Pan14r_48360 [Crateriforma conspicua]
MDRRIGGVKHAIAKFRRQRQSRSQLQLASINPGVTNRASATLTRVALSGDSMPRHPRPKHPRRTTDQAARRCGRLPPGLFAWVLAGFAIPGGTNALSDTGSADPTG